MSERRMPRKPATKFPHLQKKLQKQKPLPTTIPRKHK